MRHDGQDIRQFPRQRAKEELFYYYFWVDGDGITHSEKGVLVFFQMGMPRNHTVIKEESRFGWRERERESGKVVRGKRDCAFNGLTILRLSKDTKL